MSETKEDLRKFVEDFGQFVSKEQKEALDILVKEQFGEEEEETFNPKEGDILVIPGGKEEWVNTIFRYNGASHTDKDGDLWLHADISICCSDDLMNPYMIIHGEDQDFLEEICRHATEEERKFFFSKTGERVCAEAGCTKVFYTVPFSYANTKMIENRVKRGWIFQTEEECQAMCDKLNEAIKNVK